MAAPEVSQMPTTAPSAAMMNAAMPAINTGYPAMEGTIKPNQHFQLELACNSLRKAITGLLTDEKEVIKVLTSCDNAQRTSLINQYRNMYDKDLVEDLRAHLKGKFQETVMALMMKPAQFDAYSLRRAIKGESTDEDVLIEILCTRNNEDLQAIIKYYETMYHRRLVDDLMTETSGHFKHLLVALVEGKRGTGPADEGLAHDQARALKEAGRGQWGSNESEFNRILVSASPAQIRSIWAEFTRINESGDLASVIRRETSGSVQRGYLALIECARDPSVYFADALYRALTNDGTVDDCALIRIIVSRSEIDMVQIRQIFNDRHDRPLGKMLKDNCSGDYRKLLQAIVGEH